jgi:hypothetical protein
MAIEAKNLLVAVKAFSRGNALPLDASSVYNSLAEAQTYAAAANAYAGQLVTAKLEDGKYHTYVLDGDNAPYTLTEVGSNLDESLVKNYVQVVTELPQEGQEQGVIYINTTDGTGNIWNGSEWKEIFEDVATTDAKIDAIEQSLDEYARLDGATFTGTVTLAANPTQDMEAATKAYVDTLLGNMAMKQPGTVSAGTGLPEDGYEAGDSWRVTEGGTYAGQECEPGDLIICIKDYDEGSASDSDFMVVQANIDGAVTGPDVAVNANVVIFDGTTGKVIKDSNVTIASVSDAIAKAHEHANKEKLDTYTKTQEELLAAAAADVDGKLEEIQTALDGKVDDADLSNYYTKTDIDGKVDTINSAINNKLNITDFNSKVGEIGEQTIKEYIDEVASGVQGKDWSQEIATAKQEAQTYAETLVQITEF